MIKVTTDSTADLDYLFKSEDIPYLPLHVQLDGKNFYDGVDIFCDDIFKKYEEKKLLPKTAASGIEEYVEFFDNVKKNGAGEIVHISISGELSASYNNASAAAKEVGGVYVIDSRSLSTGVGLLVLKAVDLNKEGFSAAEIAEKVNALVPCVQASFVVDTMEFLHKGGRCSGLTALVANVLKIKPMLVLKGGKINVGQKYIGSLSKNITKYVEAIIKQYDTPDYRRIFITHTSCEPEIVEAVREKIREIAPQFKEIIETKAGATVTAHCGKGTLGILYINEFQQQD